MFIQMLENLLIERMCFGGVMSGIDIKQSQLVGVSFHLTDDIWMMGAGLPFDFVADDFSVLMIDGQL